MREKSPENRRPDLARLVLSENRTPCVSSPAAGVASHIHGSAHGGTSVVYFFVKSGQYVECVMDVIENQWQLTVTEPGSLARSEFFAAPDEVAIRWASMQRTYRADGWDGPFGRDQRI